MNKYEEALKSLIVAHIPNNRNIIPRLQELVERATPMKVNGDTDDWACPKCDSDRGIIDGKGYCAVCGQRLDWNE